MTCVSVTVQEVIAIFDVRPRRGNGKINSGCAYIHCVANETEINRMCRNYK